MYGYPTCCTKPKTTDMAPSHFNSEEYNTSAKVHKTHKSPEQT